MNLQKLSLSVRRHMSEGLRARGCLVWPRPHGTLGMRVGGMGIKPAFTRQRLTAVGS